MLASHICQTAPRYRFLLSAATVIIFLIPALLHSNEAGSSETVQYDRADAGTIKALTDQILSTKDYFPQKTFGQWLMEKISSWRISRLNLSHGWVAVVCWILLIWCILTLVAILIHFIWTIFKLIRPNIYIPVIESSVSDGAIKITSFAQLHRMAQELAAKGAFREAISTMTAALLHWLDSMNIVSFHESKTNGEYIREYPTDYSGLNEFRRFILMSEQTLYGSFSGDRQIYHNMNSLMECIRNCVTNKEQK